jgi:hypothetical protein
MTIKVKTRSEIREELVDREAIRDCMLRYSRAIDRAELDMLRTVYWPDAIDDHSGFKGNVEEFIVWSSQGLKNFDNCMHKLGNIYIQIDGASAAVESYYWSVLVMKTGSVRELLVCGRYLDRFERRNDEWRIAKRMVVHDWYRNYADTEDWSVGMFGDPTLERGVIGPMDKSYTWLGMK